jgi:MarR family transcriptional regulator, organic hydroperoxide resistance regulator
MDNIDIYVERIGFAMEKTVRKMNKELMQNKELGLTGPQFRLLLLINQEKVTSVKHLAELIDVKSSAITVMVDRLVNNGLVNREQDASDRRSVVISLSDRGKKVLANGYKRAKEILKDYLSVLNQDELEILATIYDKFMNKLNSEECENKSM